MSQFVPASFVIVGVTVDGRKFRPSDWAERLCGIMSAFGSERRMTYSPYVQPGNMEGEKCVFVDGRIHDVEPMAYTFLVNFARDNELRVEPWKEAQNETARTPAGVRAAAASKPVVQSALMAADRRLL